MTKRGFFMTLEGPEGSGKSSQGRLIVNKLRQKGFRVIFLHDPGSTPLGRRLRRILLHQSVNLSALAEALLFIGGRVQLIEERIRPALTRGDIVVCDRFHEATVAYQGFGGGLDVRWLDRIGRRAIDRIMPSLTIVLDIPTEMGFARLSRGRDRIERKAQAFHKRVRHGYLKLARQEPRRFVVVDAARPPQCVQAQIEAVVMRRLGRVRG